MAATGSMGEAPQKISGHIPKSIDAPSLSELFKDEVRGINRVVYDITSKPLGTIEWE